MSIADDKFFRARITQRMDFAPDLWAIRIKPEGKLNFVPGQYASLGIDTASKRLERPYSIVSSPNEDELEFFFELVPHGKLTPPIYGLHAGDELFVRKVPKGRFTMDFSSNRTNHVLVSTVTGVAPFVSFVRSLYCRWKNQQFHGEHKLFLLNGASRSWEFGYCEELKAIAGQVLWFNYVPTISRPWEDENWVGETGRVDDILRKYTDEWGIRSSNSVAYLCGHPEMVESAKGILTRIGFRKESLREEVYWVPDKHAAPQMPAA